MAENHPIDLSDLWSAIRRHPDFRGGVIWSRADSEMVAKEYGVDADELDADIDFEGWEDMAISEGFDFTLNSAAVRLGGERRDNEDEEEDF